MSSDQMIAIAGLILGSETVRILITRYLDYRKEKKKKPTPESGALMWLLQDKMKFLMCKHMSEADNRSKQTGEEPSIPASDVSFINSGYQFYKALGGNGDMEQMHKDYTNYKVNYKE